MSRLQEKLLKSIQGAYNHFLENSQLRIASNQQGLFLLAFLGLLCGIAGGGIIILFRLAVESGAWGLIQIISGKSAAATNPEAFETLSGWQRLSLCILGGFVVGVLLNTLKAKSRQVGVVHVLERMDYHQGNLPARSALVQFVAATLCLISGQSLGREGPSAHLGATSGSTIGRILKIPNNGVRILVGCGVAAAVAAAFNTPLAGVIFAMEVVLMEYTVIGFAPIIIAAVSATALSRAVFGSAAAFSVPPVIFESDPSLPLVAVLGIAIGCLAALFIQLTLMSHALLNARTIWLRCTLAGAITGIIALFVPAIMGTGYDTVDALLSAQFGIGFLFVLLASKLLATSFSVGAGMPAGLIGPTLFIGAAAGSLIGITSSLLSNDTTNLGFYAILGMAAMMAATLQAPLAALISLLELTAYPGILMPGMIAVVAASLTARVGFGKSSIYRHLMLFRGLDYRNTPLSMALRRVGVASVMDRSILQQPRLIAYQQAVNILKGEPRWLLVIDDENQIPSLLPATDLAHYLNDQNPDDHADKQIDLMTIPAKREDTASITMVATLQEAHEKMLSRECRVLYIRGAHGKSRNRVHGVITMEHIERSYQV